MGKVCGAWFGNSEGDEVMDLSMNQIMYIYNSGYNAGHEHTVEGCDLPVHHSDMEDFNEDVVEELIEELPENES